jgi:hypothetical protein
MGKINGIFSHNIKFILMVQITIICFSIMGEIYGGNLWGKFMGKIYGKNLWGKLMGKINGENL